MNTITARKLRWSELIPELPERMPRDGSATSFMPHYLIDQAFYEVIRLTVCANCITHGNHPSHVSGNLKLKDTWSSIKKDYGLVDFVLASNPPIGEMDYILTYGWALARKGVLIGGCHSKQWVDKSQVITKLGAPNWVAFSPDECFYYYDKH